MCSIFLGLYSCSTPCERKAVRWNCLLIWIVDVGIFKFYLLEPHLQNDQIMNLYSISWRGPPSSWTNIAPHYPLLVHHIRLAEHCGARRQGQASGIRDEKGQPRKEAGQTFLALRHPPLHFQSQEKTISCCLLDWSTKIRRGLQCLFLIFCGEKRPPMKACQPRPRPWGSPTEPSLAKESGPTFLRWFLDYYCFSPTMQGAIRNRGIPTGRMELPMYQAWPSPGHSWKGTKHTHNLIPGQFGTGHLEPSMQQRSPFKQMKHAHPSLPKLNARIYNARIYVCVYDILRQQITATYFRKLEQKWTNLAAKF